MKKQVNFLVKGSQPEPYKVSLVHDRGEIVASCTCASLDACKHWKSVFTGEQQDYQGSLSDEQITEIQGWLESSKFLKAWHEIKDAEQKVASAKRELSAAKKRFSKVAKDPFNQG